MRRLALFCLWWSVLRADAQVLRTTAGEPAQLSIRRAGVHGVRITLKPVSYTPDYPFCPALVDSPKEPPVLVIGAGGPAAEPGAAKTPGASRSCRIGDLTVTVRPSPLTVTITRKDGSLVQRLTFGDSVRFVLDGAPLLGLGEGGPLTQRGVDWRTEPIEFDRSGRLDVMQPRWQSGAYGSRNPVPLLIGTKGWAIFVASPWVQVDLRSKGAGVFIPRKADTARQNEKNQGQALSKGLPPADATIDGLFDCIVFDAKKPAAFMKDVSTLSGPAVLPPLWALGYMQSHRTLQDETQMIAIVDSFRVKKIPIDAVIYLGTGFTPRGWNTSQPSFDFNPEVFHRDPAQVLRDLHDRHVRVVLHIVPYDRDKLPWLHGSIPARPGEDLNAPGGGPDLGHIQNYWALHIPLMQSGADAFWPDEGDWFDLYERIARHRLYYEGPLSTYPNLRPWSLHRNGYLGIARYGGFVWSGDTESSWKTLEGQVSVGLNYSLSLSPYWGSDIGGFYSNPDKTGELYARWFQFGTFCPSFRSHGRTWMTSLPWGWGLPDRGVVEDKNSVLPTSMNNPLIEPVTRLYDELRYRLLPYTYTLAWEARTQGMPLMRALWLQYPADTVARGLGSEYLWGRDLLIAPVFEKGATQRHLYLPRGQWYDWWTNDITTGGCWIDRPVTLSVMPIFVRAGAIIPLDTIRQYTGEHVTTPMTLKIYPGADGDFTLYQDDGISEAYLKGVSTHIRITWNDKTRVLTLRTTGIERPQRFRVEVVAAGKVVEIAYGGGTRTLKL
ncbi:glycoside hydrolase family 31 protein [Dinghuibacter silviterrae]|uniref:Alpha-glucosidase/alpha-D-xyloside xylohydrolase n=1 Tax=Dinghuibacter silviterrae TaxID=1539049 RepID=A0A4R8DGW0_9BACT|nr:TIM-barrel domain-containing protein [Dinghuibacter silviterrae]TDW96919.1 alpha-glucosidase/alpha-D-xyloside xylohydrolase [Dinghuibacter silviterrae]